MNFHTDEWIMNKLNEHYQEALEHFPEDRIVGIFLQGSQNYGLDYEGSDVDTKLLITPSFEEVAMNKKAISTTHIRANDEHIDFKDIRLYMLEFLKQNINFLEILYTKYKIINPLYAEQWKRLVEIREDITHMNPYRFVKATKGHAMEKFHAMEHRYPSRAAIIDKYGYDGKQLHHLDRFDEFLERYLNGETFEACLQSHDTDFLLGLKKNKMSLEIARFYAKEIKSHMENMEKKFCEGREEAENSWVKSVMDNVQLEIMKIAIKEELNELS